MSFAYTIHTCMYDHFTLAFFSLSLSVFSFGQIVVVWNNLQVSPPPGEFEMGVAVYCIV